MADFTTNQQQLAAARNALDKAQQAASQAAAQAQKAQAALDLATRQQTAHQEGGDLAQLQADAKQAAAARDAAKGLLQRSRASLAGVAGEFAVFTDPRQNIQRLSDAIPFLLFPVRIETRFRTIVSQAPPGIAVPPTRHQLWVRIYPDDCSIDTFEPIPSDSELANVKNYWMNIYSAGGVENDERGAWSALVASQGSGRAGWLVDNFQPTNLAAKPKKAADTDEILVIPTTTALSAAEATAISNYWQAVWLADDDAAKQQAALNALSAAVGAARAADLIAAYVPFNLSDVPADPLTKKDVALSTAFVIFPPDPVTTLQSWTQAPQVKQFPDRFVVMGFSGNTKTLEVVGNPVTLPLYTGPDPSGDPTETIHPDPAPDGPDLFVPDELKWMVDFDRAAAAGMGLAIDLTPDQAANGFDLLMVLGVQLSATADAGAAALQELLLHHQTGRSGFALLPQGTPAHNATGASSGHSRIDDPDATFNDRKSLPLFTVTPDPTQKLDGQWLAEFLGIDPTFVATVHASNTPDQKQTRAMQTAMWPATLGYWMNTLFTPTGGQTSVFSDETIEQTRQFFIQFVSGRGALPAIRIGGQPYGILPTTAFSRIQWYQPVILREAILPTNFLSRLYGILRTLDADWTSLGNTAHWVGEGGDAHQTLLNVLAHHPSSVEYYSRNAESLAQLFNMINFWALAPTWWQALLNLNLQAQAVALLQRFGYSQTALPDLLNHFYLTSNPLIRAVVDDRPLSETDEIRAYTTTGDNYITWLVNESGSLETLGAETGFLNNQSPQALLYLYLRHALMLGYYESSYNYHRNTGVLSGAALLAMRVEPPFIHVNASATASESRFAALYKTESRITGNPTQLVSEFVATKIGSAVETANLTDLVNALKILATASTAQLERLFAEHVDIVSYRYDSWLLGLVSQHIQSQREAAAAAAANNGGKSGGIYLGAYAWVEHLKPSATQIVAAQIPPEIAAQFPGTEPLMTDPAGGGYIHAPSIQHADTAAVLRAGYLANADKDKPDTLAVNLSSDRVRVALTLIEGIRNGQSLGALLGYQFERGLHDDFTLAEVDAFIYPLRKSFPLVADAMASTKTDPNISIEAIEARNVLDGKKLVDRVQAATNPSDKVYPFGLPNMPTTNFDQQQALNDTTSALLDAYDALADLALAEGVHQAVQGNYDRVASTIDAYTTGNFPPEPQVVQTPPAGTGLTHRVAVQFRPGLPAPAGATPRAQAEPAIDDWLQTFLPALSKIECAVVWNDPITGSPQPPQAVTLDDLGLRPIDVLYLLKPENAQGMTELDDRIIRQTIAVRNPRPDAILQIQYLTAGPNQFSMFEAGALLRELRTMLTQTRPLRASDVRCANDASQKDDSQVFADAARISTPLNDLKTLANDINVFLGTLSPLLVDTVANRGTIINRVDDTLAKAIGFLERASRFAMPSSGWGFAYDWLRTSFTDLLKQVSDLVTRWDQKLLNFKNALLAYDALPAGTSDADRYAALQAAELLVSSALEPLPATPAQLRSDLDGKGTAFQNRLGDFANVLKGTGTSFLVLFNQVSGFSAAEFDSQPFDLTQFGDRAIIVSEDVARILNGQFTAISTRASDVDKQLTAAATAASSADQVQAIQAAAKKLLGDDFQIVPEFTLSPQQGGEWANALGSFNNGKLLDYLKNDQKIDFPVDEWLYGVARVRPMLHSWESALMFDAAFGIKSPELKPIQLPFVADDPWLALKFPDDHVIDSDRLLYTCAYAVDFDPNASQCGLLLDEWTEVIPVTTRDTAITFNYNRPDNEPPQSMLLVTSPSVTGTWSWDDLVAALVETLALAKKRAVEPSFLDPTVYSRFLPATVTASTSYAITISTALTAANGVFSAIQEAEMPSALPVPDIKVALAQRTIPTITTWNRLEGRPRSQSFERALQAEVRDALWMLTKQWQMGEFRGDDAGSPVFAKLLMQKTRLTKYQPAGGKPELFDSATPLETKVERRPIPLHRQGRILSLDLRLVMARQWFSFIAGLPRDYRSNYITAYPIAKPDPNQKSNVDICSHPEAFDTFQAVATRAMDGGAFYEFLSSDPSHKPFDGVAGINPLDQGDLITAGQKFLAWAARFLTQPSVDDNAWVPQQLEYQFATSAPMPDGTEKVYVAEEYYSGSLDWYSLDEDEGIAALDPVRNSTDTGLKPDAPFTTIPVPVSFSGMPNTRWWAFEEKKTNFGDIDASTTDLAKLLFMEFALVYSNDWFVVPSTLPAGTLVKIQGLAVSNVFGERFWIEAAGKGVDKDWGRWSMFTINVRNAPAGADADTTLLLLPTLAKSQIGPPIEEVLLVRDEVANMAWGVERTVALPTGVGRMGSEVATQTLTYLQDLITGGNPPPPPPLAAAVRYQVMNTVPENWIPFIPVHVPGNNRQIQLQRAAMPRILIGAPPLPEKVQPLTTLLREGLDLATPKTYFIHEEEVPRAGVRATQYYSRTRWTAGEVFVWFRARKQTGRGEATSGLGFDRLVDKDSKEA